MTFSSGDHSDYHKDSLPFIMDLQISSQNSYKQQNLPISTTTTTTTTNTAIPITTESNNNNHSNGSRNIYIQGGNSRKRYIDYDEDEELSSRQQEEHQQHQQQYYNEDDVEDSSRDDGVEVLSDQTLVINESYSNTHITPEIMEKNIQSLKNSPIIPQKTTTFTTTITTPNSLNLTPIKGVNNTNSTFDDSQDSLIEQQQQQQQNNTIPTTTTPCTNNDLIQHINPQSVVEIGELFSFFRKYKSSAIHGKREEELYKYQSIVNSLFEKDYIISTINNKDGELCATYPPELIVIEKEIDSKCQLCKEKNQLKSSNNHHHHQHQNNTTTDHTVHLQKLISQSRFARVRTRFPFPVIFYHHKNICRSSTLSQKLEYMFQSGVNSMKKQFASATVPSISPSISASIYGTNNTSTINTSGSTIIHNNSNNHHHHETVSTQLQLQLLQNDNLLNSTYNPEDVPQQSPIIHQAHSQQTQNNDEGAQNMDILRNKDILVIRHLNIRYICDLMVENKKKKFGFFVCSSEKVDMHKRYQDFVIASTPYPGVEFFAEFSKNKHNGQDLVFQWDSNEDPAELNIHPEYSIQSINWEQYKTWDLIFLTQNYFKLLLKYISDDSNPSGLLVHCISGWDRTPLFVSLIRLSLWADGEVHDSLEAWEMLILTVAYDWFLFSHQLSDRSSRGEDIFYFCFYFLEYLSSMDFSVHTFSSQQSFTKNNNNSTPTPTTTPSNLNKVSNNNNNINNKSTVSSLVNNKPVHNNNNNNKTKTNCNNNNTNNSNTTHMSNSWGKSHLDISQSAPVTPQSNSPKICIGINKIQPITLNHHNQNILNNNNNMSNYISAPSTPLNNSPFGITANIGIKSSISPNLTGSSIPVDVPNGIKKRRSSEEEIGGSWQLMGSLNSFKDEKKSSFTNSLGSTPPGIKNFHPSSSYTSVTSDHCSSETDDDDNKSTTSNSNNNHHHKTIASDEEMDNYGDSDMLTFSFEHDSNKPGFENMIKNNHKSPIINNNRSLPNNNNNYNNINNININNNSNNNNNGSKHTHNSPNLTLKEIEEKRKKRLLEIRNLFFHFYQNHCSNNSESDWKSILISYLPKFG